MIFLLIYSLYWIIFWQEFIVIPYYVTDYIGKDAPYEIVQSWAGAGAIMLFQIPLNWLTKKLPTHQAILIGFALSSLIWVIIGISPSLPTIAAGIVAFAIGEMIQAPRYYEYISEIAPPGQQGLFQGYRIPPDRHCTVRRRSDRWLGLSDREGERDAGADLALPHRHRCSGNHPDGTVQQVPSPRGTQGDTRAFVRCMT